MEFLPKALGTRPRLACEVRAEGVVAARAEDAAGVLTAVSRANLAEGTIVPGLKPGNVVDRAGLVSALRSVLDDVVGKGSERMRDVSVIVPDASTRVLLLEFDELPGKAAEALSVIRFRLKKLLPFDADDAVVSYQVMSSTKGLIQVLAVAMPREVLAEYEDAVTAAGYLPGAVLPSTLAALAALEVVDAATLVVNAGEHSVTTAIVRGGVLLLHRSVDMSVDLAAEAPIRLPLVDRESSVQEWAQQEPVGLDRMDAEAAMQATVVEEAAARELGADAVASEVAQAVSVAAAYFEDTLQVAPETMLAAGTMGAEHLEQMLTESGLQGLRVRELMETGMMQAGAVTAMVPRGWLAGVRGALTS